MPQAKGRVPSCDGNNFEFISQIDVLMMFDGFVSKCSVNVQTMLPSAEVGESQQSADICELRGKVGKTFSDITRNSRNIQENSAKHSKKSCEKLQISAHVLSELCRKC